MLYIHILSINLYNNMKQANTYANMIDSLTQQRKSHTGSNDMMYIKKKLCSLLLKGEQVDKIH